MDARLRQDYGMASELVRCRDSLKRVKRRGRQESTTDVTDAENDKCRMPNAERMMTNRRRRALNSQRSTISHFRTTDDMEARKMKKSK
jgi:hypothetical protein